MIHDLWIGFVLTALATWHVTHLLALEDGPGDVFFHLRRWLGDCFLGKLLDCFYCLSLWVAAPATFIVMRHGMEWPLIWLALSGTTCLLQQLGNKPVVIQGNGRLHQEEI